jgi:hypothetical protein
MQVLNSSGREVRGVIYDCIPQPPPPPKPGVTFCDPAEYILLSPSIFLRLSEGVDGERVHVQTGLLHPRHPI